jgi:hypothetical protein
MTLPESADPVKMPAQGGTQPLPYNAGRGAMGVVGNERLTALAGAILLVLIVVELATTASLRTLLSAHVFVGVLLAGPLTVKLGSTGYRFLRYYTGASAYVRRGPPRLALRLLAPVLVVMTLVLLGSGIVLVVVGSAQEGVLLRLHVLSTFIWIPLLAIHAVAYFPRAPRLIVDDWRTPSAISGAGGRGRGIRLGLNLGALLGGAIAAALLLPAAAAWLNWIKIPGNAPGPYFLVVGIAIASLALLVSRPLRWH